ncbi:hypothetical protein LG3211_4885 [Lysobacter gummosus]|nr:hypothetical protein LG3211_4885 [Lysobacter gummosus]
MAAVGADRDSHDRRIRFGRASATAGHRRRSGCWKREHPSAHRALGTYHSRLTAYPASR